MAKKTLLAGAALIAAFGIATAEVPPADASFGAAPPPPVKSCGTVDGNAVASDPKTTTCTLARSAARSYTARGWGETIPPVIFGHSAKTGKRYRFETWPTIQPRSNGRVQVYYLGKAGKAGLIVRITVRYG